MIYKEYEKTNSKTEEKRTYIENRPTNSMTQIYIKFSVKNPSSSYDTIKIPIKDIKRIYYCHDCLIIDTFTKTFYATSYINFVEE